MQIKKGSMMDFNFCEPVLPDNINDNEESIESRKKPSVSKIVKSIKKKVKKSREIKIDIDNISFIDLSLEESGVIESNSQNLSQQNRIEGDELKQQLENIFNQLRKDKEDDLSQLAFAFNR